MVKRGFDSQRAAGDPPRIPPCIKPPRVRSPQRMRHGLTILERRGAELEPWIERLGELRIRVFREYPYLYDGTLEEERAYLGTYLDSPDSLAVLVTGPDGGLVGATTCLPLATGDPDFREPFIRHGLEVSSICYFAESIVLPEFRGQGLGKEFFTRREAHARSLGLTRCAFCAVDRPADDPRRPPDYRPLDGFWQSRGYVKHPELQATFEWKEIGETAASPKTLTFWMKSSA